MVQRGTAGRGACMSSWHSMHEVRVGSMTRAWPLNPILLVSVSVSQEGMACMRRTFSSTINQRLQAFRLLRFNHCDQGRVDPSASFNAVKATDDYLELHVVVFVLILDFAHIGRDLDAFHTFFNESSSNLSLWLTNICLAEEELTVQVGNVNGVCRSWLVMWDT